MSRRPVIYISAVEKEFRTARLRLAETLESFGCEVKWRDTGVLPESAALSKPQRKVIAKSAALIQLVGKCFGAESASLPCLMSLTHQEALHAVKCGTRVWFFRADAAFAADEHEAESAEFAELQRAYTERLAALGKNGGSFSTADDLNASVIRLRRKIMRAPWSWKTPLLVILLAALTATGVVSWRRFEERTAMGKDQRQRSPALAAEILPSLAAPASDHSPIAENPPAPGAPDGWWREEDGVPGADQKNAAAVDRTPSDNRTPVSPDTDASSPPATPAAAATATAPQPPDTLDPRTRLADALIAHGRLDDAERELRAVLDSSGRLHGPHHPATVADRKRLALLLATARKYPDAGQEIRAVIEDEERALGREHPETLLSAAALAGILGESGRPADAEAGYRALLPAMERILGADNPDTVGARNNLAVALQRQEKFADAEKEQRTVLETLGRIRGPEHPDTLMACFNLALTLDALGHAAEARPLAQRALGGLEKILGPDHPVTRECRKFLDLLKEK